jgi:hypothetical protein
MSGHASQKVYFFIHVNPFLTYFKVFIAYLKGLLGSVFLRIPVKNFIVLREDYLGLNRFMYFS